MENFQTQKVAVECAFEITYCHTTNDGETVDIPYVSAVDLFEYLLTYVPDILVGGLESVASRANHLKTFWEAHKLQHGFHAVFDEHQHELECVVPIYWHGDEGRGKRRGQTVIIGIEPVIGPETLLGRKRCRDSGCGCDPPQSLRSRFHRVTQVLNANQLSLFSPKICGDFSLKGSRLVARLSLLLVLARRGT